MKALREYLLMLMEKGDLNKVKDLLMKFGLIHGSRKPRNRFVINQTETVTVLLGYMEPSHWKHSGLKQEDYSVYQSKKKQREKISFQEEKTFCGADKEEIFRKSILPVLITICESENTTIIEYLNQLLKRLRDLGDSNKDEEKPSEEDQQMISE